jgi:hypothetical protein
MLGKNRKEKSRQRAEAPQVSGPEFVGSLRSQRSIKEQWRLEFQLKTCKANIGLQEGNLAKAQAGVKRQTEQLSQGNGAAHSILESYIQDVAKAELTISSFKAQAVSFQSQLDALMPDAVKAAERAEGQNILVGQVLGRLELDRRLDAALETVLQILEYRKKMTSEMREDAVSLEFDCNVNLDDQRFDALLRTLPQGMAQESEKWVAWFLGREGGRTPCHLSYCPVVLPETLASCNAFKPGDRPNLTKGEEAEIRRIENSHMPPQPPELAQRSVGPVEEVPPENIQWVILR